jgi:hypothetical protein
MTRPHALFCSYTYPRPDGDSGARRLFDLLTFLREAGWAVTFRACWEADDMPARAGLLRLGIQLDEDPDATWDSRIEEAGFDAAVIAYWPLAEWVMPRIRRASPESRIIVDSVDLHWLRGTRQALHRGPEAQFEATLLASGFGGQVVGEWNVYAAADSVLTVSDKEASLMREILVESVFARTVADCEDMALSPFGFAERRGMMFLGSYKYAPNIDAAEFLCREIIPRLDPALLAEHPLYLVGQGLNNRVRAAAKGLTNVRLVGFVPSVEPYFHRCRASIVPLRFGAGTKRKMVQALMCGTPTVTTTVGAEGLDLCGGHHALIADRADDFAVAIAQLLRDEPLCTSIAAAGREHAVARHGRETARAAFLETLRLVAERPPKPGLLPDGNREQVKKRLLFAQFADSMPRIRHAIQGAVPPDATVLVCADGDDGYLRLDGRKAWHFPQSVDGKYIGNNVADSADAISQIERLRRRGAEFLLIPEAAAWWLDHYAEFADYLCTKHEQIAGEDGVFRLYSLGKSECIHEDETPSIELPGSRPARAPEPSVRLIAFYLPQYYPIPENDAWWGEGFTDWDNVAKAEPLFPGHYQPHLPADLGFYDLRLPEVRCEQADLAREHGIHGFCYYHYWFHGKRLLERPFQEVLHSGQPDFPFCLCWANEPWSRRWNGKSEDVLQPQSYSTEDDRSHIKWLIPALCDRRAIQIEGRPLLIIYRGKDLPDPQRTSHLWRAEAKRSGLEGIYLMAIETAADAGWDATQFGFDAKVLFQPQFGLLQQSPDREPIAGAEQLKVYDFAKAWPLLANPEPVSYVRYPTVFPSWDNTPRTRRRGVVLRDSRPELYEEWLSAALAKVRDQPPERRIVFINAWNEWAEGCHLEPDMRHGRGYLEATRRALQDLVVTDIRGAGCQPALNS